MRLRGRGLIRVGILAWAGFLYLGILAGCESTGDGKKAEAPSTTTTTTAPTTPTVTDVVGITLSAGATSLVADGASSTTISATLTDSAGKPSADGIVVSFTTDKGRFTTDGAKTATATTSQGTGTVIVPLLSEQGAAGTATIIATAKGITQSLQFTFIAPLPPQPAAPPVIDVAGITLEAGNTALVANGTSSTTITATLINSVGSPSPDGIVVSFTADRGRFTTEGAKTAAATITQGGGSVIIPFISESNVVGTATIVASVKGVAQSVQIALTGAGPPARIILTTDSTTIALAGTAVIAAQVLDSQGNNVPDGTAVSFTTSLAGTGVTDFTTTASGSATAIFSAGTVAGVATVTATAGGATATISIRIQAGTPGSLDFVSASPTVIGVKGSALQQKSTITFRARDQNGNNVADGTVVTFVLLSGVSGGETIAPATAGTTSGLATTILTSGTVSGPVRVQASITVTDSVSGASVTLTSSSTNVSIAGGPPSGNHIGVAPQFVNIAGQVTQGIICSVQAPVGDRFGNPVPQGTAVSFFTNGGIISAQGVTDALGNALAGGTGGGIKSANPIPHVGLTTDVTDPRTGMVTVIAVTQGEETFIDANGNGVFDGPQEFNPANPALDTPEPFIDHITVCRVQGVDCPPTNGLTPDVSLSRTLIGDGVFDPTDPFELFFDGNGNGVWDPPNGVWDSSKPIFSSTKVLFSGPTVLQVGRFQTDGRCCLPGTACTPGTVNTVTTCGVDTDGDGDLDFFPPFSDLTGNPGGFCVPNGGSADRGPFCVLVSDAGAHPLVAGTTLAISATAGSIAGTTNVTMADTQQSGFGSTFFTFDIIDQDPTEVDPKSASVTVDIGSAPKTACPGGNGSIGFSFGGTTN